MYLTVIAWIYVVLLMSIAEATSTTGTLLGAVMTFLLYGLLPLALVMYLMRTPTRRRARKAREAHAATEASAASAARKPSDSGKEEDASAEAASGQPDAGGHAAGAAPAASITAVRKEP
jgi:predicted lipid-binding transport protein (Tim44 family)